MTKMVVPTIETFTTRFFPQQATVPAAASFGTTPGAWPSLAVALVPAVSAWLLNFTGWRGCWLDVVVPAVRGVGVPAPPTTRSRSPSGGWRGCFSPGIMHVIQVMGIHIRDILDILGVCNLFYHLCWLVVLAHMMPVVVIRVPATALLTEDPAVPTAVTPSTTPGTLAVFLIALIPAVLIRAMSVVLVVAMMLVVTMVGDGIATLAAVSPSRASAIASSVALIVTATHVFVATICAWTRLFTLLPTVFVLYFIVLSLLDVFSHGNIEDLDDMILLLRILDWYGQSGRKEERPTNEETDAVIHS